MDIADEHVPPRIVVNAAELALIQWDRRVGTSGFRAARADAGLLSKVDQHSAAVRDALAGADDTVTATDLAAYADGVCDTAGQRGFHLPAKLTVEDWADPSWPLVRLLAVCQLARTHRLVP
ncbi:hypothetical protein Val02_87260 [Virgisporangium aliadipatigenens]|jgi:hypothetical protein|uniref:Uncharacterized protein n=1 Tax=Virgisporangium aliadipatigenens TaxID=741659 RepID=A0A8J3YXZ9_9ACTN|nr:DUF6401 family natural product biosynthesis protein [Virgisporangium aliadipatigenens]GIJ51840.1 hypothetical protein Val02_87260 [Virgisporangium aliadipatigenens]